MKQNRVRSTDGNAHSIEWSEVQSLVRSGHKEHRNTTYLFMTFDKTDTGRAGRWLSDWRPQISLAADRQRVPDPTEQRNERKATAGCGQPVCIINVAITPSGLKRLGVKSDELKTFSAEFLSGMNDERAAFVLGDAGSNHSDNWEWGNHLNPVDAVLVLYSSCQTALDEKVGEMEASLKHFGHQAVFKMPARWDQKEHFGFVDGLSNPGIKGVKSRKPQTNGDPCGPVNAGEILFGYINERGQKAASPSVRSTGEARKWLKPADTRSSMSITDQARYDLGLNGSYLVIRQLSQDVEKFEAFVDSSASRESELSKSLKLEDYTDEERRNFVKAKMMGRWPDGTSLTAAPTIRDWKSTPDPTADDPARNDFVYSQHDRQGHSCPLGSHVRRALPRDGLVDSPTHSLSISNRHRILRRGRLYENAEGQGRKHDRGVMFVCINADISKQFEFIHRNWLNNTQFAGADLEVDPIVGQMHQESVRRYSIQGRPMRRVLSGLEQFVTVRGGAYFFFAERKGAGLSCVRESLSRIG